MYISSFWVLLSEMTLIFLLSFGRNQRVLPGTTKKPLDSSKDTIVRVVKKFFYLRKILYGCNGFFIKFYKDYRGSGGSGVGGVPLFTAAM